MSLDTVASAHYVATINTGAIMSNIPKWAYACPRHRDGLHTWSRTGHNEEVACNHCRLTLTKAESVDLGFEPCRHYWKPIYTRIEPTFTAVEPTLTKPSAVCINCGAKY